MIEIATQGEDRLLAGRQLDLAYKRFKFSLISSLLVSALSPLVLCLLSFGGRVYFFMGVVALLYLVLMLLFSRQMHNVICSFFSIAEQNKGLAAALKQVQALERENALFRRIVDGTLEPAIFVTNAKNFGRLDYINEAVCRHFGVSREEIMSWHVSDWDPHYDAPRIAGLGDALKQAGSLQFESEHLLPSGKRIPVEVTLNAVEFDGESFVVGYFHSLVKQKEEEARIRQLELAAAQQENDRRMSRYFENAPGFFFTLLQQPDGSISMPFASAGITAIYGLQPSDVAETVEPVIALDHPDDVERKLQAMRESGCDLTPCYVEFRVRHPEKGERWVEARSMPQRDEEGNTCWHGFMHDITERKRMEEELAAREREFRTLVENSQDVVVRYDRECRRLYVNPAWERVNCVAAAAVIGKSPQEISVRIKPMVADFERMLREVMASGRSGGMDMEWTNEAGEPVCFALTAIPEFDDRGEIVSVLTMARDISDRKRMEYALAVREQESRTLVENSPDIIIRYDRECRHIYANTAFGALVEGGVATLLGKTPTECTGGADADIYEAKINEVLATGANTEFELKWTGKDGVEICSHVRLTAELDAAGNVLSVLGVGRDITELNEHRKRVFQMAFYDSLTSLPNRALFNDRLRQMLTDASWHGQLAGVMLLDLDRFKAVNDTLGHPVGDALLCETAARLTCCVRGYDTVARMGGDEFAILLPEIRSGDDLGRIASKMLESFNEPFLLEGKEVFVSSSIGIALYPDDGSDADDLIKYADSAMYFAKRSGRNNFRFYSKDLTDSANDRLTLEADLRRGCGRGELELHFQPKVRLVDGMLTGSEALLRWNHPQRGIVAPDKFVSIAEDSGMIVEIGEWVLHTACRVACDWNSPGNPPHKVAINLSVRQFQSNDLANTVRNVLQETGCYPEWIELEITESLLLDDDGDVLETLEAFRAMGITIAIDDFGTGYSSLGYLALFPIDTLKIDRSFVSRLTEPGHHAELVKAIISIAKSLDQQVVAEGVESAEQAALLQSYGCQTAQGYFYGKPMPRQVFRDFAAAAEI